MLFAAAIGGLNPAPLTGFGDQSARGFLFVRLSVRNHL
jgi:hypothetical protein